MANEPTIEMMNIALAAFEGRKFNGHPIDKFGGDTCNALPEMKYHTSWSWLMQVVEKIRKGISYREFDIDYQLFHEDVAASSLFHLYIYASKETVHESVYQFITWYNQQKQKDGEG